MQGARRLASPLVAQLLASPLLALLALAARQQEYNAE